MERRTNFSWRLYTGCQEQFDGSNWLILTPIFYDCVELPWRGDSGAGKLAPVANISVRSWRTVGLGFPVFLDARHFNRQVCRNQQNIAAYVLLRLARLARRRTFLLKSEAVAVDCAAAARSEAESLSTEGSDDVEDSSSITSGTPPPLPPSRAAMESSARSIAALRWRRRTRKHSVRCVR